MKITYNKFFKSTDFTEIMYLTIKIFIKKLK